MQISVFVLGMIVDFPAEWIEVIHKLFTLVWSVTYALYLLIALKFPKRFIYFLPVILVIQNSMVLALYVASIIKDRKKLEPPDTKSMMMFCFIS